MNTFMLTILSSHSCVEKQSFLRFCGPMSENKKKKVKKERKHTIEGKNNKKPDHKKLDHKKLDHKKLDRKKARKRLKKIEEQVELLSIPSKTKELFVHPFRTNLKEFDALHQHDELDDREEFNLFGDNLPLLDRKFEARVLFNTPNNDLPKGYVFEGNGCSYKIVKELGVGLNYYKPSGL
uniref:Uncharacterized protein n=1 Tax=Ditylenchus dipsaci TaxID=166011 RepID=A0A915DU43_9BILA